MGQVVSYLESGMPVGRYLADQLLVPFALAGGGRFRTSKPSQHTLTNIEVIQRFLEVKISVEQLSDTAWEISLSA